MERDFEELSIEPRGTEYVLIRVDGNGVRTEIILSEVGVISLGRIAPMTSRRILASKMRPELGISASYAAPAKDFQLNSDLHNDLVLLRIRDEFDGEFDFSFSPAGSKHLGERLIAWGEKVEKKPKATKQ
jgi:hypothetical protein